MKGKKKETKGEGCYNFSYLVRYSKRLVQVRQAQFGWVWCGYAKC